MSNICITTICNNKCEYCFAGDTMLKATDSDNTMSIELFEKTLDYLQRSGMHQVRILGGEPTLHKDFKQMIDIAIQKDFKILIFSNGLISENLLNYLASFEKDQITILLNVINPFDTNQQGIKKQQRTMEVLGNRVKLGINIYHRRQDLNFLLDLINKYKLIKEIRLGIAHTLLSGNNHFLLPKFYQDIGNKIIDLFEVATHYNIELGFDCGFVPCMFPVEKFKQVASFIQKTGNCCHPIIDLLPTGHFISCYPMNDLGKYELKTNTVAGNVIDFFNQKLSVFSEIGIFPYCTECSLFKKNCKGGCTAYKITRFYNYKNLYAK